MTGVSRGIGRELSARLSSTHEIFAFVRRDSDYPGTCFVQDLATPFDPEVLDQFERALEGRAIRGVVHCAGSLGIAKDDRNALTQNYDAAMRVNFHSGIEIINRCLKLLLEQRTEYTPFLLNLSSGAALAPILGLEAYCCSKAAIQMAFQAYAKRFSPDMLTVLSIAPGLVDTRMLHELLELDASNLPSKLWFERLIQDGSCRSPAQAADQILSVLENLAYRRELHGKFVDFVAPGSPVVYDLNMREAQDFGLPTLG
jgi:NAD(P)-dependent dehydrogenase (short-subunit alcohol dehydrogenase family)